MKTAPVLAIKSIKLIIVLALSASLVATTAYQNNPQVDFCVFTAAWAILTSTVYGIAALFITYLAAPIFLAILDFINFALTFSAATALVVATGTKSCSDAAYLQENKICQGSKSRCQKSKTTLSFLFICAALFLASFVKHSIKIVKHGMFYTSPAKTSESNVPTIAEV
ncbi:hypothetical protein CANINC_001432 [Pichia inconspicua]|uniref:MARVEL domain-containing protein n=1 Tax=Pichia inconspicua TaxID=52247 RepID=A0A4T0X3H6_9ASCO|nr:hypothetical protein CANINC_001432 [[Candida] inconspicua]